MTKDPHFKWSSEPLCTVLFIFIVNSCWSELDTVSGSIRVDLLYFGFCSHLDTVSRSTREWIYCVLNIVHILEQTA